MPKKKKIVITAGPTREYIDPIRFITNESSGLLGIELAKAAKRNGDAVVLIAANVVVNPMPGVIVDSVKTARDLERAVKSHVRDADVLFMSSAVCDFYPAQKAQHKLKRKGLKTFSLELRQNKDILKSISAPRIKGDTLYVGFCIETQNVLRNAQEKLRTKNLDYIVASSYRAEKSPFGNTSMDPLILDAAGEIMQLRDISKRALAGRLIRMVHRKINKK